MNHVPARTACDEGLVDLLPLGGLELDADEHLEGEVEHEVLEHPLQPRVVDVAPAGEEVSMCGTISSW